MRYQDPRIERHGDEYRIRPYAVVRTPDGNFERKRTAIRLGSKDATMSEMKRAKSMVMAKINAGTFVIQQQIRMSELLEKYRETRLTLHAVTTQGKYRAHLQKIEEAFGKLELGEVKPASVEMWLGKFTGARATKLDMKNLLGALYSYATDMGWWSSPSPTARVRLKGDVEPREKRLLTAAQVRALCLDLDRTETVVQGAITGSDVRLMVMIAAVTGMRIGEILRMRRADISVQGQVTIPRAKTEAGKRTVWLGALTVEVLARLGDGLLFARADGGPVDRRDVQQHHLRPAAERCGIYYPGFGFHAFRRLSITWAQQAGATPIEAARQAGHTTTKMTMLYSLTDVDREQERANKVSRLLAG